MHTYPTQKNFLASIWIPEQCSKPYHVVNSKGKLCDRPQNKESAIVAS